MNSRKNPIYNASGYKDTTAFLAIKDADSEKEHCDRQAEKLIKAVKLMLSAAGFSLIRRIEIRHDKSGREYK